MPLCESQIAPSTDGIDGTYYSQFIRKFTELLKCPKGRSAFQSHAFF